jgi:UDP-4-amino-4,6-dideoxy-N-acetyl-beta-L-altrosamine N-acetyltransferase
MTDNSIENCHPAISRIRKDSCRVRGLAATDLEMLLAWRNHQDVRAFMLTQHEISWQEHEAWFVKSRADPLRCMLIVEDAGAPLGYVQYNGVTKGGVADWGFYTRPGAPKGSGQKLGIVSLNHAFDTLGLHKVCGQAIANNRPSIALHKRLGFVEEGILREQAQFRGNYRSLICFGLLNKEWRESRHRGSQ